MRYSFFLSLVLAVCFASGCVGQQQDCDTVTQLCVINNLSDPDEAVTAYVFTEGFDPSEGGTFELFSVLPGEPLVMDTLCDDVELCVESSVWDSGAAEIMGPKAGLVTYVFPTAEDPEQEFACVWE